MTNPIPLLQPNDAAQAVEMIAWAAAEQQSLEIIAGGSKRALGRPIATNAVLDVSRLAGVIDYEPAELVLTVHAATPVAEIAALLEAHQQMLSFEPPDWRVLLGSNGEPTLGGVIACNLAGPRRLRAGAARDYLLGFAAVNGWGEPWKAGGKVVKNVTGYDMAKLQSGAYGTLSLLTELTVKVMPKPETACTLLLPGLTDEAAIAAMASALNSPLEVSAAAHLPATVARRAGFEAAITALRLEGPAPSVASRAATLAALLGDGPRLDAAETARFWAAIGAVRPLLESRLIWRLCPTPSAAAAVVRAICDQIPSAEAFYDWGGGLIWLALEPHDAAVAIVRAAVRQAGGHATLVAAPDPIRAAVPVFEPPEGPLAALTARVKDGFDPRRILNPGRMHQGM